MTWQCPDCKATYEYHPPPCPICSAKRAAEMDGSGVRGAAAGIHKAPEKKSDGAELGRVVAWKKQRIEKRKGHNAEGNKRHKAEGKKGRKAGGKKGRKRK